MSAAMMMAPSTRSQAGHEARGGQGGPAAASSQPIVNSSFSLSISPQTPGRPTVTPYIPSDCALSRSLGTGPSCSRVGHFPSGAIPAIATMFRESPRR